MKNKEKNAGLYIHWPFCKAKCPYCDFNSHVRDKIDEKAWEQAYLAALRRYADMVPGAEIGSIFFGGGTPSLMPPRITARIIEAARAHWRIADDCEITLEANPTSVEAEKFKAFAAAGVNRVSLGIQALNDADLKFLGREHNAAEALQALEIAKDHFPRVSFDLMYARPGQTLAAWESELRQAAALARGHLSLYQLTIERGTPFYFDHQQKRFAMPGEDLAADFYTRTQEILEEAGLPAYEVSNHAAPGQESRHNLNYWRYGDYIGIGPGAHGRITREDRKYATREHAAPEIWLTKTIEEDEGVRTLEYLTPQSQFTEALMMGLRLGEGLDFKEVSINTGADGDLILDMDRVHRLVDTGSLILRGNRLQTTLEGRMRLNALLAYILKS